MKYFLDTEFIEDGRTIDLISIGIVCEDGRKYYAINKDCDFSKASQWVKENVLVHLPKQFVNPQTASLVEVAGMKSWKSKEEIQSEVAHFLGCCPGIAQEEKDNSLLYRTLRRLGMSSAGVRTRPRWVHLSDEDGHRDPPEFWAYYADYDWVVFCQLFGTMMDLPDGFPMYCRDIKQECDRLGNPRLPRQGKGEHDALADAEWAKEVHDWLKNYKAEE